MNERSFLIRLYYTLEAPAKARQWCHLRTDLIPEALPEQTPKAQKYKLGFIQQQGMSGCGDQITSASIEGAVISGKCAAEAIIMRRLSVL